MYVSKALTKIGFTPQYSEGEEIEEKDGGGDLCLYYRAPDVIKSIEVSVEVCTPDPALTELLTGGTLLTESTTHVGYAAPAFGVDAQPNGISVEAWSRAVVNGNPAATLPYIHWVFGKVKLRPDETTLENAGLKPTFTGIGYQNAAWGDGPVGDWPYTSDRFWQWARSGSLPAAQLGYQAVPSS